MWTCEVEMDDEAGQRTMRRGTEDQGRCVLGAKMAWQRHVHDD